MNAKSSKYQNLILLLFILLPLTVLANDTVPKVKYTPEFKFTDGIYINFIQVKHNAPLEKSRIATTVNFTDPDFFENILAEKTLSFFDNFGIKQTIPTKNIWGYSRNGVLYINIDNKYQRITVIGSACHFVANVTTYNSAYYDPYDQYNYARYGIRSSSYPQTEMRQYLLDFKTGKVMEYNEGNVELILMNDPELYDEFVALRRKKRKQLKFMYLRKYNERNPLYIPINK